MKISTWRMRAVIGALSLIVVGGLLGMVTHHFVLAREGSAAIMVGDAHEAAMVSFRDVLRLDNDQAAAIHEILMRHQALVDHAWESVRARLVASVDSAHSEIRTLLSPEQQERFEAWVDRHGRNPNGSPISRWLH